jgi:hypothetical protein
MSRESELWQRLAKRASSASDAASPDQRLVARIVDRWHVLRPATYRSVEAWQKAGFRTALAVSAAAIVVVLLNTGALAESLGQGLSFLHEVCELEVLP